MTTEKLHKVLARAGVGSRRQMEQWISAGRVLVDGRVAQLGDRVATSSRIVVDGRPLDRRAVARAPRRVIAYHKPSGEVTTRSDPEGRATVFERLPPLRQGRWITVGRLDVNTSGLLLFTNDGELAHGLMHPRQELVREYAVRIYGGVTEAMRQRLLEGIDLGDGRAAFERVEVLSDTQATNDWYRVRIREGRRREVRRLWESQDVQVSRLIRLQYGPIQLPAGLRRGRWQELGGSEVAELCRLAGLKAEVKKTSNGRRSVAGGRSKRA